MKRNYDRYINKFSYKFLLNSDDSRPPNFVKNAILFLDYKNSEIGKTEHIDFDKSIPVPINPKYKKNINTISDKIIQSSDIKEKDSLIKQTQTKFIKTNHFEIVISIIKNNRTYTNNSVKYEDEDVFFIIKNIGNEFKKIDKNEFKN